MSFYDIMMLMETSIFLFVKNGSCYPSGRELYTTDLIILTGDWYGGIVQSLGALSKDAEKRYQEFRRRYPGLEQRITQKHIASYLGITPVFLSMMRKEKKL